MNNKEKIEYLIAELGYKFHSFIEPVYVFIESIRSVLFWLPVMWKDRDWDHNWLLKMMEIKIRKMHKNFTYEGMAVHSKKELRGMLIAANTLKRLRENKYDKYLYSKHDEKWGKINISFTDDSPCSKRYNSFRDGVTSERKQEEERKELRKIIKHEDYMIKQDLEWLGQSFKNITKWWD